MKRRWVTIVIATTAASARADDGVQPELPSTAPGNASVIPDPPSRPASTGTFAVGASYSTDDKFGSSASIVQADLFGTGKLLSLDAMINDREQRFGARFSDPHLLGSDLRFAAEVTVDSQHLADFTRLGAGSSISLSHVTAPHTRTSVTYRFEAVHEEPERWIAGPMDYNVSALRVGSEYNTLSEPFLATHGSRVGGYVEVAAAGLGSDVEDMRTSTFAETHRGLGGGLILHLRGSLESVSVASSRMAAGERLYFAGSSQIRGYAPTQLGPSDGSGHRLGGDFAAYASAELELPVTHGLSAVGFVDGGGLVDVQSGELAASTGLGLVWRSPVGPIGGYLAWTATGGPTFVFGIGQAF
ncbi:hypothetical protein BH11MYX1_BH11MYX1_54610 [soil metagenome]